MECYAGIDDGFFRRGWPRTLLVLAAHCFVEEGKLCPCLVLAETVKIDGMDSTEKAIRLVNRAKRKLDLRVVLLDTVVFAGFNILDAEELYRRTSIPVIAVYWYPPNKEAVTSALRKHFADWEKRLSLLEDTWNKLSSVKCEKGELLVAPYGIGAGEAWRTVCRLQVYTRQPEPLFTAHVLASALSKKLMHKG